MREPLKTVAEYRARAADIRTCAEATSDLTVRAQLLDRAADDDFDAEALDLVLRLKRISKVEPSSDPTPLL